MKPFPTQLPAKLHGKLKRFAGKRGVSMAEIVREAIAQYLNK